MTVAHVTRIALCFFLFGQTLGAQGKTPPAPKPDPSKTPPIVVSTPGAVSNALRPPLELDTITTYFQQPYAGGGTRASSDGRYVAINRPVIQVAYTNRSSGHVILRGYVSATIYKGTPPGTPPVSIRPTGGAPTVQQMFDDMRAWAFDHYSMRSALTGTLSAGQITANDARLSNPLDSLTSLMYNGAKWTPRSTIIFEVNTPYTIRADIAHEVDGRTRYYRADRVFRFDATGRAYGGPMSFPPPPPPSTSRPTVEVRN